MSFCIYSGKGDGIRRLERKKKRLLARRVSRPCFYSVVPVSTVHRRNTGLATKPKMITSTWIQCLLTSQIWTEHFAEVVLFVLFSVIRAQHTLCVDQSHEFVIQELIHLCILMFAISVSHILPPQIQIFVINRMYNFRRHPVKTHNHKKSKAHRKQQLLCEKILIMRICSHQVWRLPCRADADLGSRAPRLGLGTCGIGSKEEPANGASFRDLRVHPFQ